MTQLLASVEQSRSVSAMVMPQSPQQSDIYLAADEQQADKKSTSSQHGIHEESSANSLHQRRRSGDDGSVHSQTDRTTGNLEHVNDSSGQTGFGRIQGGDRKSCDGGIEKANADAQYHHAGDQLIKVGCLMEA